MGRLKRTVDEEALHAVLLQKTTLSDALRRDEDLRREKVERLRAAIAEGTYSVSAETLAEKMIEQLVEMDSLDVDKDIA